VGTVSPIAAIVLVILAIILGVFAVIYLLVPVCKLVGKVALHIGRFLGGEVMDVLRLVGSIITAIVMVPLTLANVILGRWSSAAHYGRGFSGEIKNVALCIYRMAIGHPARLLGLTALTEGIEKRLPAVVANAPGADAPSKRVGQFPGYKIVGSLATGGSGAKLYVAEPEPVKLAAFARAGRPDVNQVVIKIFSLKDGSSLPQIVRESRALDAARKLGLVLDHDLTPERFFYVMEYVPGQSLSLVTQQLHGQSGPEGLEGENLNAAVGYAIDLVRTLTQYHKGGLWHKDVKPDNIIVDGTRAHLVDFGLVTPLRSAMTLTTHGTEYFRDPELVRMALKGVKVHEVDGTRFDIYAAGAVLYSVIENSFPAHGVLSQITKRCPEALRWIVRRAMTDYDKRYTTAGDMGTDLEFVRFASDPFAIKPIELPSMRAGAAPMEPEPSYTPEFEPVRAAGPASSPRGWNSVAEQARRVAADASRLAAEAVQGAMNKGRPSGVVAGVRIDSAERKAPRLRVVNWWTGAYEPEGGQAASPSVARAASPVPPRAAPFVGGMAVGKAFVNAKAGIVRRPAAEQLARARARAEAARRRVSDRLERRGTRSRAKYSNGINPGVWVAVLAVPATLAGIIFAISHANQQSEAPAPEWPGALTVADDGSLWAQADLVGRESDENDVFEASEPAADPAAGRTATASAGGAQVVEIGGPRAARTAQTARTPAPRPAPVSPEPVGGTVLLVVDLPKPLSQDHRKSIERIATRLAGSGFSLIGDYPGNAGDPDVIAAQLSTTAEVLARCAGVASDTPAIRERLANWLAEHPEKADLIAWFRHDGATPGSPVQCFISGPSLDRTSDAFDAASKRFNAGVNALR